MWSELVIVSTPILHLRSRVVKAHEPMGVQALGPELAIETLDVAVVRRLARPREVEHDTLVISPEVKVPGDKFTAIIDADSGGITDLTAYPLQRLYHVFALVVEAGVDCRREAREGVDYRQHPNLATRCQLVMNEVHGPDMVGMGGFRAIRPQLRLDPSFGNLVAELEVHLLVKAIDSLRIDGPPVALEQDMNTTITVTHSRLADVPDLQLQLGLLAAPGLVDIKRPIDLQYRTCAPDRDLPVHFDRVDKLALAGRP